MSDHSKLTLDKLEAVAAACLHASDDAKKALYLEYLALAGELILEQYRGTAILSPLLDIHDHLDDLYYRQPSGYQSEDRRKDLQAANPQVMARVCAVIDILVAAGFSPDHAAQTVTRQLMTRKLMLPEEGGDSRGWKRVQIWRHRLTTLGRAHPQFEASQSFKNELIAAYGAGVANKALTQALWDRRSNS
ncbi:MAG: hypothetical protein ABL894_01560 [Hyphomicrobium sp.]